MSGASRTTATTGRKQMKKYLASAIAAAALLASAVSHAQVPSGAPAGTTGLCKDGTYYSGASKSGACSGHKGVKTWYGSASAAVAGSAPAAATASVTNASAPVVSAATLAKTASAPVVTAAAAAKSAGGPGQVWVNTGTKVYHCPGDKYYGNTKQGAYMSEADAKAKGFHGVQGKSCQ